MTELISTRDPTATAVSYEAAVLQGAAPDWGLYTPPFGEYPSFDSKELRDLRRQPYAAVYRAVRGKLVGYDTVPADVQDEMADRAYSPEAFPAASDGNLAPLEYIGHNIHLLNLSLGPTAGSKDFGMRSLREDVDAALDSSDNHRGQLTMLGATYGDAAAAAAFKGSDNTTLFMLSPESGMSDFQRAQMAELSGGNIHNISLPVRFDMCQKIAKTIMKDPEFSNLGTVNATNWGRIVGQVPYYISGYLQAVGRFIGKPVDVIVPDGAFDNVLAAHVARRMGLPIRKLIVATNENDMVRQLIQTGIYASKQPVATSSPSMDVAEAPNYERLIYEILKGNAVFTREYMTQFETEGRVNMANYGLNSRRVFGQQRALSESVSSTHRDRIRSIQWIYDQSGRVIDPRTADAVTVVRKQYYADGSVPSICVATDAPVKFEKTIEEALGFVPEREARFADLESRVDSGAGFVRLTSVRAILRYIRDNRPDGRRRVVRDTIIQL